MKILRFNDDRIGVINKGELMLVEDKAVLMKKLGEKRLILHLCQQGNYLNPVGRPGRYNPSSRSTCMAAELLPMFAILTVNQCLGPCLFWTHFAILTISISLILAFF